MKRLTRWTYLLTLAAALCLASACGKGDGAAAESGVNSDAEVQDESDAKAADEKAGADEASKDKAPKDDAAKAAGEGADKASAEDPQKAPTAAEGKVAEGTEAKLKEMGPEEEAAVKKRCGDAFDNTVNIMQTAGAPPKIVAQMRQQREKTVASCLEQAKIDPSGAKMIDCMLAARLPIDIQTCTRKFGNIKPLKPPKGVGPEGK